MLVVVATPSIFSVSSAYSISASAPSASKPGNVATAPKRLGCLEMISARTSLLRLATSRASCPVALLAEAGAESTHCRDVVLLHIRERTFDRPIGLFTPLPHRRTFPERQDGMRMNV